MAETAANPVAEKKPYYDKRVALFEKYKARQDAESASAKEANVPIKITMPDGAVKEGIKGVTTPTDIALSISKGLMKKALVAYVNGAGWDMGRPFEGDATLSIKTFDDPEGQETYWHSTAHILGQALELEYGVDLTIGPPIEEGFYYDCYMGDRSLTDEDKPKLQKRMEAACKEKQKFERVVVSRDEALECFLENKFKVELINEFPPETVLTLYRNGPLIDLCRGPHVPTTGYITAVAVNSCSRAHWRADVKKEPLQRVYGISFPDKKLMAEYQKRIEEAKKRDHRVVGLNHELFFFHHLSPGSCFFLPHGARLYNDLLALIREKYWEYEYTEVITPNIYNFDLWHTSGHAAHYKENMFSFKIDDSEFGLKPMNCPGHCVLFGMRTRSFRELPMRLADFGVLHRNEASGALHGLTRVRRFQQDDAHIFCRAEQVESEVLGFLKFMDEVYGIFGLEYQMALSTRPEGYLGELEVWNKAEAALENALNQTGKEWQLNPADGAFYGPKIDITVFDALRRKFQCATVQLDFQLPIRFNLNYTAETGTERPVIIHRAIMGSMERMIAILTEHFAGKWPFWLSPRQVMVVPISENSLGYAKHVREVLYKGGFYADVDASDRKMQKKVREAQLAQYNYILVVGDSEAAAGTVNVRTRDNHVHGMHSIGSVLSILAQEKSTRAKESIFAEFKETGAESGTAAAPPAAGDSASATSAAPSSGHKTWADVFGPKK
mmetsp:Transcript_3792/g.4274  ORF Transcript_3792/g.4274 Transcript_3792/m.4274 type:complete len:725 (-) Transcript_3792:256-2430(-)|eukprot:CAMPEP_0197850226 /NCGR_PEP_ID=MMETSP1438-20131217/14682_1 /TAXON_ID=1461541 /ORGANISM="Pterosperma sp., Strain CCMP1384" /LENGTH=724 /DNA_ID=CAMNT_0043463275 /DNA_START=121 /DNA_END=2295 /DNA_ORIENTATION=+